MNAKELLQWHYLIFLLPFGIAAVLLLLSALRFGHKGGAHGSHGSHGHAGGHGGGLHRHGSAAHGPKSSAAAKSHTGQKSANAQKAKNIQEKPAPHVSITNHFVWNFTGLNRAPLMMVAEAFFLTWGLCGYWANHLLLHSAEPPTPGKLLPSLLIALVGGLVGARVGAEIIGRMMPEDESLSVSREGLYGLTGKVAYPVSETGGRIHIYDEHGTLHDETCRVAAGHAPIGKGRRVLILDRDAQGQLIVEEIPETAK